MIMDDHLGYVSTSSQVRFLALSPYLNPQKYVK